MKKQLCQLVILFVLFSMVGCTATKYSTKNLITAIEKDNLSKVQNIVANIDVNNKGEDDIIPIILAVEKGNAKIVSTLIESGAQCDIKDEEQNNLLHIALLNQKQEVANLLLDRFDLNSKNALGKTSIDIALENENYSFLSKVYFKQGDIENVIKYCELALANNNDTDSKMLLSEALLTKSNTLKELGSLKDSIEFAKKAKMNCDQILAIRPDDKNTNDISNRILAALDSIKTCSECNGSGKTYCLPTQSSSRISYRTKSRLSYRFSYSAYSGYTSTPYTEYYQVPYTEHYTIPCQICCGTSQKPCSTCKSKGLVVK